MKFPGWKTFSFPVGAWPIFTGLNFQGVSASIVQERPAGRAGRKEEPDAAHVPGKKTVEGVALNQTLGETSK